MQNLIYGVIAITVFLGFIILMDYLQKRRKGKKTMAETIVEDVKSFTDKAKKG